MIYVNTDFVSHTGIHELIAKDIEIISGGRATRESGRARGTCIVTRTGIGTLIGAVLGGGIGAGLGSFLGALYGSYGNVCPS